ncbi:hypothetical protein [Micromonospora sp. NPDC050200]|uniref:hypothetical protein n=1 Tax=Micromonospora sp. NPDC050200 TaxID=3155664 RepID=UPI0033F47132
MTHTEQSGSPGRLARLGRRLNHAAVILPALLITGAALLYVPFHTGYEQDRWAEELRERGRPAQAYVYDVQTKNRGTTMFFRYELDGVTHEQEVACMEVCLPWRSTTPIWVSRTDPSDFVTDFGQLSGHRGRFQGGVGAVGFVILAFPLVGLVVMGWGRLTDRLRRRPQPRVVSRESRVSMPRSKRKRSSNR